MKLLISSIIYMSIMTVNQYFFGFEAVVVCGLAFLIALVTCRDTL